jgi:hypothetical protein
MVLLSPTTFPSVRLFCLPVYPAVALSWPTLCAYATRSCCVLYETTRRHTPQESSLVGCDALKT